MAGFRDWCTVGSPVPVGRHQAAVIESRDDVQGCTALAVSLPAAYAETSSLARIAERSGKTGVAKFLRNKLPLKASARSGDAGEILATAYLRQECGYVVGPSRLIHRDHQEWAMRGDDALGAVLDPAGQVRIAKAESKSRARLGAGTVKEAREGLARNDELPSPHSLAQFAERLLLTEDSDIGDALLDMQMSDGIRPGQVRHVMFLFTGSDPSAHVTADLLAYSGPVAQLTVTLRVQGHQRFIKDAYEEVISGGA